MYYVARLPLPRRGEPTTIRRRFLMKSTSKTPVVRAGVRALGALVVLSPLAVGACEVGNPAGDQASTGVSAPSVVSSPARPARGFAEHVPAPVAAHAAHVVRPVDRT